MTIQLRRAPSTSSAAGGLLQPLQEKLVDNLIATATLALYVWIVVTVLSGLTAIAMFIKVWRE